MRVITLHWSKTLPWIVMGMLSLGCSSSSGERAASGDATDNGASDSADATDTAADGVDGESAADGADAGDATDGSTGAALPIDGTELCEFDAGNIGKEVGKSIENFGLKTYQGDAYWLHQNCGTDTKVVWMILGTGWCGACETYVNQVQPLYEQYKDQGLEVMWVIGADEADNPPSLEFCENFVKEKGVTFPVMRDAQFFQVYGHINPHSTALPHQYILDARTMELVHASGGINEASETKVKELLGVE